MAGWNHKSPQVTRVLFPAGASPVVEQSTSQGSRQSSSHGPGWASSRGCDFVMQRQSIRRPKRKRTHSASSGVVTTNPFLMAYPPGPRKVPTQVNDTSKAVKRRDLNTIEPVLSTLVQSTSLEVAPTKPTRRGKSPKQGPNNSETASVRTSTGQKKASTIDAPKVSGCVLGTIHANTSHIPKKTQVTTKSKQPSMLMNLPGDENTKPIKAPNTKPTAIGLSGFVDSVEHPPGKKVGTKQIKKKSRSRKRKAADMVPNSEISTLKANHFSAKPPQADLVVVSSLLLANPPSKKNTTDVLPTNSRQHRSVLDPPGKSPYTKSYRANILVEEEVSAKADKNKPAWLALEVSSRRTKTNLTQQALEGRGSDQVSTKASSKLPIHGAYVLPTEPKQSNDPSCHTDIARAGSCLEALPATETQSKCSANQSSTTDSTKLPRPRAQTPPKEAKLSNHSSGNAKAKREESCPTALPANKKESKRTAHHDQASKERESNQSKLKKQKRTTKERKNDNDIPIEKIDKQDTGMCFSSLLTATLPTSNMEQPLGSKGMGVDADTGTQTANFGNSKDATFCTSTTDCEVEDTISTGGSRKRSKPARYSDEFQSVPNHATPTTPATNSQQKSTREAAKFTVQDGPNENENDNAFNVDTPDGEIKDIGGRRNRRPPSRFSDEYILKNTVNDDSSQHLPLQGKRGSNYRGNNEKKPSSLQNQDAQKSSRSKDCSRHGTFEKQGISRRKSRSNTRSSVRAKNPSPADVIVIDSDSSDDDHIERALNNSGEGARRGTRAKAPPSKRHGLTEVIENDEDDTNWSDEEELPIKTSCDSLPTASDLITANASRLLETSTACKRQICYDQVEVAVNNEVLVVPGKREAPSFLSIEGKNACDVVLRSTVTSMQPNQTKDRGSCCYFDLEVASGTTYLRMLAKMAPVLTPLEEPRLLPRCKNVSTAAADVSMKPSWHQPPRKRHRIGLSAKLRNTTFTRSIEADQMEVAWSNEDVTALKIAYNNVNALSGSFWDDISDCIEGKTASQCQEKWLALLKTPPRKSNPRKIAAKHQSNVETAEGRDDIFLSTPLRGGQAGALNGSPREKEEGNGFPSFDIESPIAFAKKAREELSADAENLDTVDFRFKPGFVRYMRSTKTDIRRSQFRSSKARPGKAKTKKNASSVIFEQVGDGDVDIKGNLSPGGTLRVQNHSEEPDDDIFYRTDESGEESDEDDIFYH